MSIWKRKKYVNGIDYDKNKDYSAEMQKAKEKGDTALLAQLEEERNRKIEGEGLGYSKTYDYIDIGTKIENGIRDSISAEEMNELLFARRDKANKNEHLNEFKNDEIQKRGLQYYFDTISGAGLYGSDRPEKDTDYEKKIAELFSKIENAKAFDYDLESDDVYKVLKKSLSEQARRASEDTLSNLSQMGGGTSSYAVAASTMAANDYNQKLAEQVPRLYQLAFDRYQKETDKDFDTLNSAIEMDRAKQNEFTDALGQYNKDREYALDGAKTYYDMWAKEDELTYKKEQDEAELAYKREKDKVEAARELVRHYEENGITVPKELLEAAGISDYEAQSKELSSVYREKLDLERLYEQSRIDNINARTYNTNLKSESINSPKSSSKSSSKEKETTKEEVVKDESAAKLLNERKGDKIIIDGVEVSEQELADMLKAGKVITKKTEQGVMYTFAR